MRAWRIYPHTAPWGGHPDFDPLDGQGGLHGAGRWHHAGTPILYAAASPSLAMLEVLVHLTPVDFGERTLLEIDVPDDIASASEAVGLARLVQLLRDAPEGDLEAKTRDFGTAWAREGRSLALLAPSIVMPHERNVILNPRHPRAPDLEILRSERVTLDPRLLRSTDVPERG